jgi:hypothetical protein
MPDEKDEGEGEQKHSCHRKEKGQKSGFDQ